MISDLQDHGIVVKELHVNPRQRLVGVETDTGERMLFTYEQLWAMARPEHAEQWTTEQAERGIIIHHNQKGTS